MLEDCIYASVEFRPIGEVDHADTIGDHIIFFGKHGTYVVYIGGFSPKISCGSRVQ